MKPIPDEQIRQRLADTEVDIKKMRKTLEWYARCDIAAKAVCEGSSCRMEHDDGARARAVLQSCPEDRS